MHYFVDQIAYTQPMTLALLSVLALVAELAAIAFINDWQVRVQRRRWEEEDGL